MRLGRSLVTIVVLIAGMLIGFLGWSQNSVAKTEPTTGRSEPAAPHAKPNPHVAAGQKVYVQYCATCHGEAGKGDGPGGANLPIKPQNLADGRVMNVEVESSTEVALERAAVDAVRRWTFSPATRDGKKVPAKVRQTIKFEG